MEETETHENYAAHLLEALDEDSMSQIDFDRMREWLRQQQQSTLSRCKQESEAAVLKEDYRRRIAGMVKAIAAVRTDRESHREAMAFIESLETMTAEELIASYRRTSGRFRDHFPASYGLPATVAGRKQDLSIYK